MVSDGSDSWEMYTVQWEGSMVGWGNFVSYSVKRQMNTLGEKFPWVIWRLGETMPDKPKEWGDCKFLKREVIEQPPPTMYFAFF